MIRSPDAEASIIAGMARAKPFGFGYNLRNKEES